MRHSIINKQHWPLKKQTEQADRSASFTAWYIPPLLTSIDLLICSPNDTQWMSLLPLEGKKRKSLALGTHETRKPGSAEQWAWIVSLDRLGKWHDNNIVESWSLNGKGIWKIERVNKIGGQSDAHQFYLLQINISTWTKKHPCGIIWSDPCAAMLAANCRCAITAHARWMMSTTGMWV